MTTKQPGVSIRPMRVGESAALLGLIILLGLACFYGLRPMLERAGWASYPAYLASLAVVFVIMLVWSSLAYLAEGQPRTLRAFLERNRLEPIRCKVMFWGVGLGVFMFLLTAAMAAIQENPELMNQFPFAPGYLDLIGEWLRGLPS
jgi:hypothetical protein